MTQQQILVIGGFLALVGALTLMSRARKTAREATHAISLLWRVVLGTVVVTGAQWLVLNYSHDTTLKLVVLALPTLLAVAVVTRALTVTTVRTTRRGGGHR